MTTEKAASITEQLHTIGHIDGSENIDASARNTPRNRLWSSWRATVLLGTAMVTTVCLINTAVLIWAKTTFDEVDGVATLYTGSCDVTQTATLWVHLAINILGTALLSASNNCAQLLSSPTREDIDKAHAKFRWLDIGIPNVRNLTAIPRWRVVLWFLLWLSSVPLHLFYNSVIFDTVSANEYDTFLVTEDFVRGADWNVYEPQLFFMDKPSLKPDLSRAQADIDNLRKLDNADCIQAYTNILNSEWGSVLLVTSMHGTGNVINYWSHTPGRNDMTWICTPSSANSFSCNGAPIADASNWTISGDQACFYNRSFCGPNYLQPAPILYCLAQPTTPHCTLRLAPDLLLIVLLLNIIKAVCLSVTLAIRRFEPLATIGDAISSFMSHPEEITADMGPVSAAAVRKGQSRSYEHVQSGTVERSYRWASATSRTRWLTLMTLCFGAWAAALIFLVVGINTQGIRPTPPHGLTTLWREGFGTIHREFILELTQDWSLVSIVLLANLPQLIISLLYILYNSMFTSMVLAAEYSKFGSLRKALRVTDPRGQQKSTLWLQLPYRYIAPLMIAMAILHWIISRSFFMAQITIYDAMGKSELGHISACGYSPIAVVFALALAGSLIVALLALSIRKLEAGVPLVGSCSLAISASAHPGPSEVDPALKPLMYGVIHDVHPTEGPWDKIGLSSLPVSPFRAGVTQ